VGGWVSVRGGGSGSDRLMLIGPIQAKPYLISVSSKVQTTEHTTPKPQMVGPSYSWGEQGFPKVTTDRSPSHTQRKANGGGVVSHRGLWAPRVFVGGNCIGGGSDAQGHPGVTKKRFRGIPTYDPLLDYRSHFPPPLLFGQILSIPHHCSTAPVPTGLL